MTPRSTGSDFGRWPSGSPLKVDGGLKARSARGAIGESWWSRRFLSVLESFALGTRLTRGRNYARTGQVLALEIGRGRVSATVQGSRPKPYQVTVDLEPFPELVWAKVEVALAEQALFSAQLLSGEVPPGLDEVVTTAGASLFPSKLSDLGMRCSCPDQAVPCKHIAATFYLLAEAFDADPFQMLAWRGRERDELLARLRALRGGQAQEPLLVAAPESSAAASGTAVGAALALVEVVSPGLAETVDRFWTAPIPLPARRPTVAADPDLLLRQLPPPGRAIGGDELVAQLRDAYQKMAVAPSL